jgi:hypothetical protein
MENTISFLTLIVAAIFVFLGISVFVITAPAGIFLFYISFAALIVVLLAGATIYFCILSIPEWRTRLTITWVPLAMSFVWLLALFYWLSVTDIFYFMSQRAHGF